MTMRHAVWTWLVLLAALGKADASSIFQSKQKDQSLAQGVPTGDIGPRHRDKVRWLLDNANICVRGPAETFNGKPQHYQYFLDHPDRAVQAWRKLGAKCVTINAVGQQQFGWSDENGSEVKWETIHRTPDVRIWLAEGKVRPAPLMPLVPVKVLVVLRHTEKKDADGTISITHQSDLFVHTDSVAANAVMRMLGSSARNTAEQGLGNLQMFFSVLSQYLERHPEHVAALITEGQ